MLIALPFLLSHSSVPSPNQYWTFFVPYTWKSHNKNHGYTVGSFQLAQCKSTSNTTQGCSFRIQEVILSSQFPNHSQMPYSGVLSISINHPSSEHSLPCKIEIVSTEQCHHLTTAILFSLSLNLLSEVHSIRKIIQYFIPWTWLICLKFMSI